MAQLSTRIVSQKRERFYGKELEYVMPKRIFEEMTKDVHGDRGQWMIDYINDMYGLLGHVTSITLEGA